ncbi:MAG TPA: hypothetical protein VFC11_07435, partial [Methylocella sp.]|nr:hypothetical protein [Methylocella sp.]
MTRFDIFFARGIGNYDDMIIIGGLLGSKVRLRRKDAIALLLTARASTGGCSKIMPPIQVFCFTKHAALVSIMLRWYRCCQQRGNSWDTNNSGYYRDHWRWLVWLPY